MDLRHVDERWLPARALALMLALGILLGPRGSARATTENDLCTGAPTCIVSGAIVIDDPGTQAVPKVLDFGTRDLVLASGSRLSAAEPIGSGVRRVVLRAGSIQFDSNAAFTDSGGGDLWLDLVAVGGGVSAASGDVRLLGTGSSRARVELVGLDAGQLSISAARDVSSTALLDVHQPVPGPTILPRATSKIVIDAAGTIDLGFQLNATKSEAVSGGGSISLVAGGPVLLQPTAQLVTGGGATYAMGGDVVLRSASDRVEIHGKIDAHGNSGAFLGEAVCGDGGSVLVEAATDIVVDANINAKPGALCTGGTVGFTDLYAVVLRAGGRITQTSTGTIDVFGTGADGEGDFGSAGDVLLRAEGDVSIGGDIDAHAPGSSGAVVVRAGGNLTVSKLVDASASSVDGDSGYIQMTACDLTVTSTGRLDARMADPYPPTEGTNLLQASGQMRLDGTARSELSNRLEYREASLSPIVTGTVDPAAVVVQNAALDACVGLSRCGNGVVEGGEVCDDGGNGACDGCAADCQRRDHVCGDGIPECGEECDDGNATSGDGCDPGCVRPGTEPVMIAGSNEPTACIAEWRLLTSNGQFASSGRPTRTQKCVDGDPRCDADRTNNLQCTVNAQICLRVPDERYPTCSAGPVASAALKTPNPLDTADPLWVANGNALLDRLVGLGITVKAGATTVATGSPDSNMTDCTPAVGLVMNRTPGRIGKGWFNVSATTVGNVTMDNNAIQIWCMPNSAVCGNGVVENFEGCDDGNLTSCDGCSAGCQLEQCGNGIVECGERCDEGPQNGISGGVCTTTCTFAAPSLRIPGGGSKKQDCGFEWAPALNPTTLKVDRRGIAKNRQDCVDNDPSCDFDPTVGSCAMHLWACVGAADPRLGCDGEGVASFLVKKPKSTASGTEAAARDALIDGIQALGLPVGPGERCTARMAIEVPTASRKLQLATQVVLATGRKDSDNLTLRCLAP